MFVCVSLSSNFLFHTFRLETPVGKKRNSMIEASYTEKQWFPPQHFNKKLVYNAKYDLSLYLFQVKYDD